MTEYLDRAWRTVQIPQLVSHWQCKLATPPGPARHAAADLLTRRFGAPINDTGSPTWKGSAGTWVLGGDGFTWTAPPDWEAFSAADAAAAWQEVGRTLIEWRELP